MMVAIGHHVVQWQFDVIGVSPGSVGPVMLTKGMIIRRRECEVVSG